MRSKSETDENLILQIEELICPSAPRRYRRRELAAATHGFAEAEKIGRGGFGAVYRGFLADQERHVAIKVLSSSLQAQAKGMREFQAEVKVMTRCHRQHLQLLYANREGQGGSGGKAEEIQEAQLQDSRPKLDDLGTLRGPNREQAHRGSSM